MALTPRDTPGIANHQFKVVIAVDGGGYLFVVVFKLFVWYQAVSISVPSVHEVSQRFVPGLLARDHVRVVRHIVPVFDLVGRDHPRPVRIKHVERHLDQPSPIFAQITPNPHEKLRHVHKTVAVSVKEGENVIDLTDVEIDAEVC